MAAKKVILKLDLHDNKDQRRVFKAVSTLPGIDSVSVDMKDQKLTVIGLADPVDIVAKLRKVVGAAHIISVGPAKEEKKDGDKKDGGDKKEGDKTKDGDKKPPVPVYPPPWYNTHYPYHPPPQYFVRSAEEDPNSCVIC